MRNLPLILCALAFATACGGGGTATPDAAPVVDAFQSACGQPGDLGNAEGVGKFCQSISDCNDTTDSPLCSIIGDSTTHFCTHTCTLSGSGSGSDCGSDASCECNSGGNECGCTPNICL